MDPLALPSEVGLSLHGVIPADSTGQHSDRRTVVLTFDDGPRRNDTDRVVAELSGAGAHATFFALLVRARAERSLLADLLAAGHEVGLHGVDHRRLTRMNPGQLTTLLRDAKCELEDLTGTPIQYFRPSYGAQNADSWCATVHAGLVPVVWQRECREWDTAAPEAAFAELENLEPGMVVLAHDTVALPADGADSFKVPLVERGSFTATILSHLAEQRLVATSLSLALRSGTPAWRTWLETHAPVPASPPAAEVR